MFADASLFKDFLSGNKTNSKEVGFNVVSKRASAVSTKTKLFRSYAVAVLTVFVVGAISPANAYSHNAYYSPEMDSLGEYYLADNLMLDGNDGFIAKINPQTEYTDRTALNEKIIHEVKSGDTVSTIAEEYGLRTDTVLWENNLNSRSTLKIGQKLVIPPIDGVSHVVASGQDVKKIAAAYSVDAETLIKQNKLDPEAVKLKAGESIFVPGAKPLPVVTVREGTSRVSTTSRTVNTASTALVPAANIGTNSSATPKSGKIMIYPSRGKITQGYRAGHYAYDIADVSKPPIFAAMNGTVVKASSGTWGGGYGNHIIIDHGNGLKTLYAHMEYLSVSVGDTVTQGQIIGKMGNTGNVRGRTGIHLHFEVIQNGVKKSPANYF